MKPAIPTITMGAVLAALGMWGFLPHMAELQVEARQVLYTFGEVAAVLFGVVLIYTGLKGKHHKCPRCGRFAPKDDIYD